MKAVLLGIFLGLILPGAVRAEGPGYEARPDLIPMGGIILFFNSKGPLSYDSLSPAEIPAGSVDLGPVKCEICQHGLSIPIFTSNTSRTNVSGAQGDGSYQAALVKLQTQNPQVRGIYDVKIDFHRTSILGIYRRMCTEISARAFK